MALKVVKLYQMKSVDRYAYSEKGSDRFTYDMYALCEDGSVWIYVSGGEFTDEKWRMLPEINRSEQIPRNREEGLAE